MGQHAIDNAISLLELHEDSDGLRRSKLIARLRAVREGRCGTGFGCLGCPVRCNNVLTTIPPAEVAAAAISLR